MDSMIEWTGEAIWRGDNDKITQVMCQIIAWYGRGQDLYQYCEVRYLNIERYWEKASRQAINNILKKIHGKHSAELADTMKTKEFISGSEILQQDAKFCITCWKWSAVLYGGGSAHIEVLVERPGMQGRLASDKSVQEPMVFCCRCWGNAMRAANRRGQRLYNART